MKLYSVVLLVLSAAASFAQDASVVRWQKINGVITAPGINNPVGGIASGGLPWTTTGGTASVNFRTGTSSSSWRAWSWQVEMPSAHRGQ